MLVLREQGVFLQRFGPHGLGDAEVDDLRHGQSAVSGDENVRGLEVAVDDALLMRVLDCLADMNEQPQPLLQSWAGPGAPACDRLAVNELHRKVRPPVSGGPGLQQFADAWMVHAGQRLALLIKACQHLHCVHAQLDELQRDLPPHRLCLLRTPHHAETAVAKRLDQTIRPNHAVCGIGVPAAEHLAEQAARIGLDDFFDVRHDWAGMSCGSRKRFEQLRHLRTDQGGVFGVQRQG